MENKIWNVKASIETTWVGSHKLVNLTKREQEELNRWLDENHRQFSLMIGISMLDYLIL